MRKFRAEPGKGIVASKLIASTEDNTWYRCVGKNKPVYGYRPYELGIHCGSLKQAEYFSKNKYGLEDAESEIYKITLNSDVVYSDPVSDQFAWNSIESIYEILNRGFGVEISLPEITNDYRNGKLDKSKAAKYIKNIVGQDNIVIVYNNETEYKEEDIIVLDESCIQSIELVD